MRKKKSVAKKNTLTYCSTELAVRLMFQMYFLTPRTDRTKGRVHKLSIDKLKTKAD